MITLTYFDFLCNLTVLLIILFTALSYATGLFYIAELAEEFPTLTKRIIRYIILAIAALHALAFFSALPKLPLAIGLLAHLSYLPLLTTFPVLPLSSPIFYLALLLLLSTQLSWHYSMPSSPYSAYPSYGYNNSVRTYSNAQLLAFYLLFVWLVPLVFFVAGSVTSQSLPVMGERVRADEDERKGKGGRWSIAGIGRWCKREKTSGGKETKDERTAADRQSSHRYEPNPAYYGNAASTSTTTSAASYSSYQSSHQALNGNGAGTPSWYGQQQQQQQPGGYGSTSSEGEWMGQLNTALPHMAVRQRSHIN